MRDVIILFYEMDISYENGAHIRWKIFFQKQEH